MGVKLEEIEESPKDVLAHLMEEKKNLYESVEGKAADLYNKMRHRLAHSGNDYTKV